MTNYYSDEEQEDPRMSAHLAANYFWLPDILRCTHAQEVLLIRAWCFSQMNMPAGRIIEKSQLRFLGMDDAEELANGLVDLGFFEPYGEAYKIAF